MCDTTFILDELYQDYIHSVSDEFMDDDEAERLYDEYLRKCSIVKITSRPILPFSSKNLNYASMMLKAKVILPDVIFIGIPVVQAIPVVVVKKVYHKVSCEHCGCKVLDTNLTRHKKTKKCKTRSKKFKTRSPPNQVLC